MITKQSLAEFVRQQCELWGAENNFSKHLDCMCAIASHALTYWFRKHSYQAVLAKGEFTTDPDMDWGDCHCWVELDGEIWDITASQFDLRVPNIIRTWIDDERYGKEECYSLAHQFIYWPDDQQPSLAKTKEIPSMRKKKIA